MPQGKTPVRLGLSLFPVAIILGSCVAPSVASTPRDAAPAPRAAAPQPAPRPAPAPPPVSISLEPGAVFEQGALVRGRIAPAGGALTLDGEALATAPDGRFIIGLDRDATGTRTLRLNPRDGRPPVEQQLTVVARSWSIQNIDAPLRGAARSDAEFDRRRPGELAQMAQARAREVTSDGWQQSFRWPVAGRISGVFGSQRVYRGTPSSFHNGVDIAVPTGTPYVAPADGVVILAASEPFTLEGYLLMIDHGNGLSSVFLHSSRLDVHTGDVVRQGQQLGAVGMTGRATGPHLHWAMRWRGAKIDAQRLAGPMR